MYIFNLVSKQDGTVEGLAQHILASTPLIVFGREARHMNVTVLREAGTT
jgi:hypothetical protein